MLYVCVSINKEVVNKQTFSDKNQAIDFFQTLHGEKIREEREGLKLRLQNSIEKYTNRIMKEIAAEEKRKIEGVKIHKDLYEDWKTNLTNLHEKKAKKEADLEQLCLNANKIQLVYEAKYNDYKKNLFTQEPQLILHISGIYQNGYLFTVIEEKYYYIGAKIDSNRSTYEVIKKLPPQFDRNRISLYVFKEIDDFEEIVEMDNLERTQKMVNRSRNQILRKFQNGPTRVREI